jgi:hypothetical protein
MFISESIKDHRSAKAWCCTILFSIALCSYAPADHHEEAVLKHPLVTENFRAVKPTIVMEYAVSYRLMGIRILSIAKATIETTEGYWRYSHNDQQVPCALIHITLQSHECDPDNAEDGRIYINDRIVSVVTMPKLDTIYYVKRTDEFINPPFKRAKRVDNIAIYNLENGELDYFAQDFLKGTIETNLSGAADMATQGREVSKVLQLVSDVYHGREQPITPASAFRIHVNCDGVAVPFAADTRMGDLKILGSTWSVLEAEVMPAKEAPKVKSRPFRLWATSFDEVANRMNDPVLRQLADEAPPWGMTPLLADYGLALGSIRCTIERISTRLEHEPVKLLTRHESAAQPQGN